MMCERRWSILCTVLAWVIGLIFIYAAVFKIADPEGFARDIKHYKILPLLAVNCVALLLPWWELAAGAALFVPNWRRAGAGIIFFLTCVFIAAVASAIVRGLDISCGCFGSHSMNVGARMLALDLGILFAAGLLLWHRPSRVRVHADRFPSSEPA